MNVADALTSIDVQDGSCIIRQGDAAVDGMYFIEDGHCRITYLNEVSGMTSYLLTNVWLQNGEEHEIGEVGQGQYFGGQRSHSCAMCFQYRIAEFALITNHARYASVFAIGHVKLACKHFLCFRSVHPSHMTYFSPGRVRIRTIARSLRATDETQHCTIRGTVGRAFRSKVQCAHDYSRTDKRRSLTTCNRVHGARLNALHLLFFASKFHKDEIAYYSVGGSSAVTYFVQFTAVRSHSDTAFFNCVASLNNDQIFVL
jgi:CRP-like cAMP-binding protein